MQRIRYFFIYLIFFAALYLNLVSCNLQKNTREDEVLLSCNILLGKQSNKFYLLYKPNEKKETLIAKKVKKIYWKDCEIVAQADQKFLFVSVLNGSLSIKEFPNYDSANIYFAKIHNNNFVLHLDYCEDVYSLLTYPD